MQQKLIFIIKTNFKGPLKWIALNSNQSLALFGA